MKKDMEPFSLAVIEDIEDIRTGLKNFFSKQKEISAVAVFDSMESFFKETSQGYAPDVILSDIGLPGIDGIKGIKEIAQILPDSDVIMLTVFKEGDKIFNALCAGATGYLLKGTPMPELKKAVIAIRNGGSYMSPSVARRVVDHFKAPPKKPETNLTAREREVIDGLMDGLSYKMIADRLSISVDTVNFRIKSIYKKLHINSKGEIFSKVIKGEI